MHRATMLTLLSAHLTEKVQKSRSDLRMGVEGVEHEEDSRFFESKERTHHPSGEVEYEDWLTDVHDIVGVWGVQ